MQDPNGLLQIADDVSEPLFYCNFFFHMQLGWDLRNHPDSFWLIEKYLAKAAPREFDNMWIQQRRKESFEFDPNRYVIVIMVMFSIVERESEELEREVGP